MRPIVDTQELAQHIAANQEAFGQGRLVVLDVRWYLTGKSGSAAYAEGHLPGAVFVDLDRTLASDPAVGPGRHPLPRADVFQEAMRNAGVSDSSFVVAYDDAGGSIAARLWWLLRHFGHDEVAILDGGITEWAKAEIVTKDVPRVATGDFHAKIPIDDTVDRDDVRSLLERGALVLDARARERYRGDLEPVDARPGHIPGALNAPWAENLKDGVFLSPTDLRAKYEALGATNGRDVVVYCGSGVTACHDLLALELAGIGDAKLYEGSWSDWAKQPKLPAAKGEAPGKL